MSSGGPELRARLRRIARLLGLLLVAILVIMVLRAETVTSRQPVVVPRAPVAVDGDAVAAKLATMVKRKTVSVALGSPAPPGELDALHADLAAAFPKVTA
ncbi:MAG: hypothetical protein JWO86_5821, partial [Myxococcaceae bacterium]|nr:hypothetical protein [Myxococcaceae bacterium]